jgi:hypothetical protein
MMPRWSSHAANRGRKVLWPGQGCGAVGGVRGCSSSLAKAPESGRYIAFCTGALSFFGESLYIEDAYVDF